MMSHILFVCFLVISVSLTHAAIPNIDFTNTLNQFVNTGTSWCTTCAAFSTTCGQNIMGCAGDNGGGGTCPADACPRVFTFSSQNNIPIWNINVATSGNPYRAFSYIPICTNPTTCTEPFIFSFSVKYTPHVNAATPIFNNQMDYMKLLFWGDGNNILGVKNGQLLGLPNGGVGDLVGSTTIGTNNAFSTPFPLNTWTNIAVKLTYNNGRATLAFFINGQAMGSTTGSIGTSNSGLQFGAYTWGGTMYNIQYTNIQFSAANVIPNPTVGGATVPTNAPPPATQAPPQPATQAPAQPVPTMVAPVCPAVCPDDCVSCSPVCGMNCCCAQALLPDPTSSTTITNPTTTTGTMATTAPVITSQKQLKVTGGIPTNGCFQVNNGAEMIFAFQLQESIDGGKTFSQPMGELGLPTVTATFFANNMATPVTMSNTLFNAGNSHVTGSSWQFNLLNDQPNPGLGLIFPMLSCPNSKFLFNNAPVTVTYTMTATLNGQAYQIISNGANGFAGNQVNIKSIVSSIPTTLPTSIPTSSVINTQKILKLMGGIDGCWQGTTGAQMIYQLQLQESNDGGKTWSSPMGEIGLPTVSINFQVQQNIQSSMTLFNVGNSKVTGTTWTFDVLDDQPNVGIGLILPGVTCSNNAFTPAVTYTVTAMVNGQFWTVIANNAPGFVATGQTSPAITQPMQNPITTAINKNTFGTNMVTNAVQMFTINTGNCWMQGTTIMAELQWSISQTDSSNAQGHGPATETGLPDVSISIPGLISVSGGFNVENSRIQGNSWLFTEQNDQPNIGGSFAMTSPVSCQNGQLHGFTFQLSAQSNGIIMPTTSTSNLFHATAANSLNDGSSSMTSTKTSSNVSIYVIIGVIVGVVVLILGGAVFIRHRRQQQKTTVIQKQVGWDTAANHL